MKNVEIKLKVLGQIDDMTKELIKDFMRFCTFYCFEENEENKENEENEEQTEAYRKLLERIQKLEKIVASIMLEKNNEENDIEDIELEEKIKMVRENGQLVLLVNAKKIENQRNFDIENQRKILEEILKELEKNNPPYSIESMKELMEIYLEYDLFRQGKVIEWFGCKDTISNSIKILDAQNRIISILQRKTDKEREIFRNANVLCGIKRKILQQDWIKEIKDLYGEVLPFDIAQVTIADLEKDNRDLVKNALNDYLEYMKKRGIDNEIIDQKETSETKEENRKITHDIFLSKLYKQLGDIMGMWYTNNQEALDMYHLSIKKDPDNYEATYKLVTKFIHMDSYECKIKHLDIYKVKEYAVEQINRLENKKKTEPLNIAQVRYILAIMKQRRHIDWWMNGGRTDTGMFEIEDWVCKFIKEYIEDNKFYDTFFGEDAQFYRQKTMNYISLRYLYGDLAAGYRDIKHDMKKSEYYWKLYNEDENKVNKITEQNEKADHQWRVWDGTSKIIDNINEKGTEK